MGFLRIYLAICVANSHLPVPIGFPFITGGQAVQVFFLISGFYVSLILKSNKSYQKSSVFIGYRFSRIFATYWVTLPLVLLMRLPKIIQSYAEYDFGISLLPIWISINSFIFGSDTLLFLKHSNNGLPISFTSDFHLDSTPLYSMLVNPPSWSLPLELIFYLLAPFLFRSKFLRFSLLIISLVIRMACYMKFGSNDPWTYRFFPSEIAIFIGGMCAFDLYEKFIAKSSKVTFSLYYLLIFLSFLLIRILHIEAKLKLNFDDVVIVQTTLLIFCLTLIPGIFHLFKNLKFDKTLGDLSFALYLLHFGVITFLLNFGMTPNILTTILPSIVLSILILPFTRNLERNLRSQVDRFTRH
jgi:peptidoglycan/LPS O-acetylase OafA/YrhL